MDLVSHTAWCISPCVSIIFNQLCSYYDFQDLPFDPTGELDSLRSFIENNIDICKWVGITVVSIQVRCSLYVLLYLSFSLSTSKRTLRSPLSLIYTSYFINLNPDLRFHQIGLKEYVGLSHIFINSAKF